MKYIEVVLNQKSNHTDRLYTYKCNEDVPIGSRVLVPFGQGNKTYEGFVFTAKNDTHIDSQKLKQVLKVMKDEVSLSEESINLCCWMKEKYACRYMDAVSCFIPPGASMSKQKIIQLIHDELSVEPDTMDEKILQLLKIKEKMEMNQVTKILGEKAEARVNYLKSKGVLSVHEHLKSKMSKVYRSYVKLKDEELAMDLKEKKTGVKQCLLLEILTDHSLVSCAELKKDYGIEMSTIRTMEKKGIIEVVQIQKNRVPYMDLEGEIKDIKSLTLEQEKAIQVIVPSIEQDIHQTYLIHGITGSGKTEIYMQLIQKAIEVGKNAIMLVPEISLTLQMVERFKGRFGESKLAILHSKLSMGERYDEWIRIKRGDVRIVIGARSSLFAPLKNMGIVIVDEEHEPSYKSDHTPKYDTVDTARKRAEINDAVLVLGTATPTVTSYYKSELGAYNRIELLSRYNQVPLPSIEVIDMREELQYGNKSIFSKNLYDKMQETLLADKQVILFLNRRGYASFISCRNCGYVLKCPSCGISMTYHMNSKSCVCHYCAYQKKTPEICPECQSKYIKYFGVGTEKVEAYVKEIFPEYTCERLDMDTSSKKGSIQRILGDFKTGKTRILVGTQIIAKGLDFPNVGLVGIVAADISLNIPDYRSSERTFQLITQAAGRAGRGDYKGQVIVQTYKPDHYAITASSEHDYHTFYNNEIVMRQQMEYPPFVDIIQMMISGTDEKKASVLSRKIMEEFKNAIGSQDAHYILGPRPAPRQKINDLYRFQILIKCKPVDRIKFRGIIDNIKDKSIHFEKKGYHVTIDINPYSFM